MIKGSCCSGSVKFELASPPSMMGICHCSRCRNAGASALAFVDKNSFTLLEGREFIQRYVRYSDINGHFHLINLSKGVKT